jgi:hypothetical protein
MTSVIRTLAVLSFVIACHACLLAPANAQQTQAELRQRVDRMVRSGMIHLEQPVFEMTDQELLYHFPKQLEIDEQDMDLMAMPLEFQLRVASIRRYRLQSQQQRDFWVPVLNRVENEIGSMLQIIKAANKNRDDQLRDLSAVADRIDGIFSTELDVLAKREGKQRARKKRGIFAGIRQMKIRTELGAECKYMSEGQWVLHAVVQNGKLPLWQDTKWLNAGAGAPFQVGERTRFMVKWNDGSETSVGVAAVGSLSEVWTLVFRRRGGFNWELERGQNK